MSEINLICSSFSYQSEFGDHYLRKSNETLCIVDCDISYNQHEVLLVQSNSLILDKSNMSETTIIINGTTISKNGRGLRHFSRYFLIMLFTVL